MRGLFLKTNLWWCLYEILSNFLFDCFSLEINRFNSKFYFARILISKFQRRSQLVCVNILNDLIVLFTNIYIYIYIYLLFLTYVSYDIFAFFKEKTHFLKNALCFFKKYSYS
jgi:hypothetical protein